MYDENRMEDFIMFEAGLEVRLLIVDGHIGKHHFVFYCVPNCPYLKVVQGHFPIPPNDEILETLMEIITFTLGILELHFIACSCSK